ncbi:hypothetical protein FVP60_04985 [Microbacterium mitrae]|uniref:Lipoprotein n=1 Tax=Microbacterium mitrae TaxID=664640 RepID=A0A5C8HQC5_9MICO|nr:hypothetical protein [Microbacterium mitrae]TXK06316.1 hypothetical protein FVP60_04985 [Microbacterium mitrae]
MKRMKRRLALAAAAGAAVLALSACAAGSGTTQAAAAAQQLVVDSGEFVEVDIAPSTKKNSREIFAWVKVDTAELTAAQLSTVVKALGTATRETTNCTLVIVGVVNDAWGTDAFLRPAAAELGLSQYLTEGDYQLNLGCDVASQFATTHP